MVDIKPFKAIRPKADLVQKIASHPYDVVTDDEARQFVSDNPYSYLRIDRSEADLPQGVDPYSPKVYQKAKENLETFQKEGWLVKDPAAYFYIYQLTMAGHSQTGLVLSASVEDYENKEIKKHEFTTYKKEIDRINHFDVTDANTSPIFLTYPDDQQIDALIEDYQAKHQPVYDFSSFYDVHHRVWVIDEAEAIHQLEEAFRTQVDAFYIADGHHRTESAIKVSQKRAEEGRLTEEGKYFLSVAFPKDQMKIYDYNRLVNVQVADDFLDQLANEFDVQELENDDPKPKAKYQLTMYWDGQWYSLEPRDQLFTGDTVKDLDASLLQDHVFEKFFGIKDPRSDERLTFVGGIRGIDYLKDKVDQGEASLAFVLFPTEMDDLLRVADEGKTMPPKSTWFEPKLLSGLFVRDLESK